MSSVRPLPRWSIGLYAGPSPLALAPAPGIAQPVLSAADVTDVPAGFLADPFLLRRPDHWALLFEVKSLGSGHGEIGLAASGDGRRWEYQRIVLREPFHLSYPYVFEWDGGLWMVPESIESGGVRLYRADSPWEWRLAGELMPGRFADPSLVRWEGFWWLFACDAPLRHDGLRLFFAPELAGPWREHPRSPLVREDPRRARPAGRLVPWQGRLLRFAQDCVPWYGHGVRAFEILELSPEEYREREVPESPVLAAGEGWNGAGMHHADPHPDDSHPDGAGGWLAAVDGRAY